MLNLFYSRHVWYAGDTLTIVYVCYCDVSGLRALLLLVLNKKIKCRDILHFTVPNCTVTPTCTLVMANRLKSQFVDRSHIFRRLKAWHSSFSAEVSGWIFARRRQSGEEATTIQLDVDNSSFSSNWVIAWLCAVAHPRQVRTIPANLTGLF